MIHKKILDAAESEPSASVERLATAVNGASADLVERVLEEYGDPAESGGTTDGAERDETETPPMDQAKTNESESAGGIDAQNGAEPDDPPALTMKQREALEAIRESPEATQGELAERFGVTQSTINNRLNSIEGFDWKRRRAFAASALGDETARDEEGDGSADDRTGGTGADPVETDGAGQAAGEREAAGGANRDGRTDADDRSDVAGVEEANGADAAGAALRSDSERELLARIDELSAQVDALERRLDGTPAATASADTDADAGTRANDPSPLDDPDLAVKVVRACLDAADITEDEEDRILKSVVGCGDGRA